MGKNLDVLIKEGLIYDGTRSEPFAADVGISEDRIVAVQDNIHEPAALVINAKGLSVSPGFIDTHAHSDFTIIADPRAEGKISQGVTTEINGNCGMSAAPILNKVRDKREADLRELGIKERWKTFPEYFSLLERQGCAVNFATLTGHGNIRGSVVGYGDVTPSRSEIEQMSALLCSSLEEGALGMSTGLIYPPGIFSGTEELVALSKNVSERSLICTSHMRSEGDTLIESMEEILAIGKMTGVRVHISHLKTAGERNWHKADEALALLNAAKSSGIAVTCDRYPYIASSTELDAVLPAWVFEGGDEKELARLQDEKYKERIRRELQEETDRTTYWDKVLVSSVSSDRNQWMEGKSIADISSALGTDGLNAVFRILVEERLRVGAIFLSMCEENLRKFLTWDGCMIGSDSSARSFNGITRKGRPHPRGFGTFPRLLGKYARDERLLTFQNAVHKSTLLPAVTFGLKGRGMLREGMYADIAIFDQDKIIDNATFDAPFQKPSGIHYVLVNGIPAVWEGEPTGRLAGRVLRHV